MNLRWKKRPTAVRYHNVRRGETYYGIARSYGLNVQELLQINNRSAGQTLSAGEKLLVSHSSGTPSVALTPNSARVIGSSVRVSNVPWWPVAGNKLPLSGKLQGVSIEAESMSFVHAVAGGKVVWTGPYRGFGNVVLINSKGYIYLYGGNEDLFVNMGETVDIGGRIGRLASTGPTGGTSKMYFSVFRDGQPVAPEKAPRR